MPSPILRPLSVPLSFFSLGLAGLFGRLVCMVSTCLLSVLSFSFVSAMSLDLIREHRLYAESHLIGCLVKLALHHLRLWASLVHQAAAIKVDPSRDYVLISISFILPSTPHRIEVCSPSSTQSSFMLMGCWPSQASSA
jgi:hypothetical protein